VHVPQCEIVEARVLRMPLQTTTYNTSYWTHIVISNVLNPAEYDSGDVFQIAIQNADRVTLWLFRQSLVYFVSPAPQLVGLNNVTTSSSNIRVPTNYTFELLSIDSSAFAALANVSLLISIRLPSSSFTPVKPYQQL